MSLVSQINLLATRIGDECQALWAAVNGKAATSHSHATTDLTGVTATAAELNKLDGATVTVTELNHVDGVTSNIQTQINGKAATSHTHTIAQVSDVTADAAEINKLDGLLTTKTELGYVDGVTSNIQTQLNGKAAADTNDAWWLQATGAQAAASSTWTNRQGWATLASGDGTGFSHSNGVFTCTKSGWYIITASLGFNPHATATGRRMWRIVRTRAGVEVIPALTQIPLPGPGGADVIHDMSCIIPCSVGDTIEFQGWQNVGGNLSWSLQEKCSFIRMFDT